MLDQLIIEVGQLGTVEIQLRHARRLSGRAPRRLYSTALNVRATRRLRFAARLATYHAPPPLPLWRCESWRPHPAPFVATVLEFRLAIAALGELLSRFEGRSLPGA